MTVDELMHVLSEYSPNATINMRTNDAEGNTIDVGVCFVVLERTVDANGDILLDQVVLTDEF
jgi:hypothetical protein